VGLTREVAATRLIAVLQRRHHFSWPQQNGIVGDGWLVAVVPAGSPKNSYSNFPVGAFVYRWRNGSWSLEGHVAHLPPSLNVDWFGGWFVQEPGRVTSFALTGTDVPVVHRFALANTRGRWRVSRR
jgi:hypothetical protein